MILLLVHREGLAADFYVNGRNVGQFKANDGINTFTFLPPYTNYNGLPESPEDIRTGLTLLKDVPFSATDKYASAMVIIERETKFYRDGREVAPITNACPYDLASISTGLSLMQKTAQENKVSAESPLTEEAIIAAMEYAFHLVGGVIELEDLEEISVYNTAITKAKEAGLSEAQAKLVQAYFAKELCKAVGRC